MTERFHINGIHSLEETVDYILTHQGFSTTDRFWRMSVKHRQLLDLIEMGAIIKHSDNAYEFVNLTREGLEMVRMAYTSWNKHKRTHVYKNRKLEI